MLQPILKRIKIKELGFSNSFFFFHNVTKMKRFWSVDKHGWQSAQSGV